LAALAAQIFSTLDLTSGFWQMQLDEQSQPLTTLGKGQCYWVTSPMGLLGCPASFQWLTEMVLRNINNVLSTLMTCFFTLPITMNILKVLEKVLERLHQNHLKVNLDKYFFGNREAWVLAHT
jgi:hypothetical protein